MKLTYRFSSIIAFLAAVYILDVSVNIGHLTSASYGLDTEKFDYIDSFSELIFENLFGNDQLFPDNRNNDHQPQQKHSGKFSYTLYYALKERCCFKFDPEFPSVAHYISRNATFHPEDFSHLSYEPPDFAARA